MVPFLRHIAVNGMASIISAAFFALFLLAPPPAAAEMSPEAAEYRRIGLSMPWELSPEIAAILDGLPDDQREKVEREIEMIVHELVNSRLFYNEFVFHFRTSASPLHIAAQDGDVDEARRLLDAGADANAAMKPYGHTPLSLAVSNRNLDVAELLLERGADPNGRLGEKLERNTPLMLAAMAKNAPMLRLLLVHGADANLTNEKGTAAIRHAAAGGTDYDEDKCLAVVDVLLEHGAVPDHIGPGRGWDSIYSPVLFSAAEWGMLRLAKRLVDAGADVDFTDQEEFTPLLHAIANRRHDAVAFFLDRGAKFDPAARFAKKTVDETSPEVKAQLLRRGLFESPPLLRLAAAGDVPGLRALAEGGASLSEQGVFGENALAHAAMNRRPEALRFLLENGVGADVRDNSGWTPLFYAARSGDMDVLSPLLAVSTGTWVVDEQGETALHQAAKNGDADMIRALVQAGAEVNRAEDGSVASGSAACGTKPDDCCRCTGLPNTAASRRPGRSFWPVPISTPWTEVAGAPSFTPLARGTSTCWRFSWAMGRTPVRVRIGCSTAACCGRPSVVTIWKWSVSAWTGAWRWTPGTSTGPPPSLTPSRPAATSRFWTCS